MSAWQLAEVNIARMIEPLDSPRLADFVAALDLVNAAAEAADGFVWRLKDEGGDGAGDATAIQVYEDPWLIVNLTVWRDYDSLRSYVYGELHRTVLRRRREWFTPMAEAFTALWWLPAGTVPTVAQAEERLTALREKGPTEFAFTFRDPLPPPDAA